MSKEQLTHSEKYVKKTNTIILMIGLSSLLIFIFGLVLLIKSGDNIEQYEEPVFTDNADVFGSIPTTSNEQSIEFSTVEGEIPLTTTPDPIPMGEVVLGTEAKNVLTLGTNGKSSIKIVSVELADPPAAGFVFNDGCGSLSLTGDETCHVTMSWKPVVAGNVQNNFIISWHELNLGKDSVKAAKVPVTGVAVEKEDCNYCETSSDAKGVTSDKNAKGVRYAIGPDGKVIGIIDEDGYVRDANGNIIGRVGPDGLIVDKDGNVIGVAENRKAVYDEYGNLIGYVNPDGTVVDLNGNVIGRVLPDGTVVDKDGNVIGRAVDTGFVYDENGNIIGKILPDGTVVDMDGNVIGRVLPDGTVVDLNGNVIGTVTKPGRVAVDENGKVLGVVMPDGSVVDENGNTIGVVDENGNVVSKGSPLAGKRLRVAYDANGNIIGYVDENGNLLDVNGNVIGKMLPDGTIVDIDGNVIGYAGEEIVFDEEGRVIGKIVAFDKIPITPQGKVLGTLQNDGSIENERKQIIGRALPNGLVKDNTGKKIIAKMVRAGTIIGFGCNQIGYLDNDGTIKKGNEETNYQITPDGIVLSDEGKYIGEVLKIGRVFDNDCNLLGTVDNSGIVKDINNRYVGCVNPDGSVLNENGDFIGAVGRTGVAVDLNGKFLGEINTNNIVVNAAKLPVGCVGLLGDVFNSKGVYIGRAVGEQYAYSSSGEYINKVDNSAKVRIYSKPSAGLSPNGLIVDDKNNILGVSIPSKTSIISSSGAILGRLFPDGHVYDGKGVSQGMIKNRGWNIYNSIYGTILPEGEVVNLTGEVIGVAVNDGSVISRYGDVLGRVNAKGEFFNQNGEYKGGVVVRGAAIGYDGSYIGYATSSGKVIDLNGKNISFVTHDKKVANDKKEIIGEIIPEGIMVDALGNYKGFVNSLGDISDLTGGVITAILPGGSSDKNLNILNQGFVIDFGGNVVGVISIDGNVLNIEGASLGKVLSDGNVMSVSGKVIGEVVSGDIVVSNSDKVVGYVNFDGKIVGLDGSIIGKAISGGLALDMNDHILGKTFKIGATILGNDGKYKGRLAPDGSVVDTKDGKIGYIKSNGSFIDMDKKVSGYVLGEVAKNKRN